jgi:hypothetical protein
MPGQAGVQLCPLRFGQRLRVGFKALQTKRSHRRKSVEEIDRAIDFVLASPRRWPTSDLDTGKFVLRRFPYAAIYHERKSVVRILAIAHGHRQPGYWKDRV